MNCWVLLMTGDVARGRYVDIETKWIGTLHKRGEALVVAAALI